MKDFYYILGVLPTAEDIVIRAAYRALASRYHPDKSKSSGKAETQRMQEINEAYEVLSDQLRRAKYDEERKTANDESEPFLNDGEEDSFGSDRFSDEQWTIALNYNPGLDDLERRLGRYSFRLALTYRAVLMEGKEFSKSKEIAQKLEVDFLSAFFGPNGLIREAASYLILNGFRERARELNKVVKVLGPKCDAQKVLAKLLEKQPDVLDSAIHSSRIMRLLDSLSRRHTPAIVRSIQEDLAYYAISADYEYSLFNEYWHLRVEGERHIQTPKELQLWLREVFM